MAKGGFEREGKTGWMFPGRVWGLEEYAHTMLLDGWITSAAAHVLSVLSICLLTLVTVLKKKKKLLKIIIKNEYCNFLKGAK